MKTLDELEKMNERKSSKWGPAGTLVLWPNSIVRPLLDRVCCLGKPSDLVVTVAALPLELTCSTNCRKAVLGLRTMDQFCIPECPVRQCFEGQISPRVIREAKSLRRNAEVRPMMIKELMDHYHETFSKIRGAFSDFSWICAIEGVTVKGLKANPYYCHVDCNISGWGSDKSRDKSRNLELKDNGREDYTQWDLAKRKTFEETGIQIDMLLERKWIREFTVLSFKGRQWWIYVPTNALPLNEESIDLQEEILLKQLGKFPAEVAALSVVEEELRQLQV